MKKRFLVIGLIVIAALAVGRYHELHTPLPAVAPVVKPKVIRKVAAPSTISFDKTQFSLTDPTSIWIVVNKQRQLSPQEYIPTDLVTPNVSMRVAGMQLRQPAAEAMQTMFAAAAADGVPMRIASAYRSYTYQVGLYNGYVKSQGQSVADTQSARPGYSEHQTGLAADVSPLDGHCSVQQCFADTPAGKWLAVNDYKYGFIIRYVPDLTAVTGYEYEPWHIRYIGVPLATEMHRTGVQTLEQFFDLGAAPNY